VLLGNSRKTAGKMVAKLGRTRSDPNVLNQARKYTGAFDEAAYHSNNPEFIQHYRRVFERLRIDAAKFVLTE